MESNQASAQASDLQSPSAPRPTTPTPASRSVLQADSDGVEPQARRLQPASNGCPRRADSLPSLDVLTQAAGGRHDLQASRLHPGSNRRSVQRRLHLPSQRSAEVTIPKPIRAPTAFETVSAPQQIHAPSVQSKRKAAARSANPCGFLPPSKRRPAHCRHHLPSRENRQARWRNRTAVIGVADRCLRHSANRAGFCPWDSQSQRARSCRDAEEGNDPASSAK